MNNISSMELLKALKNNLTSVIYGKEECIDTLIVAILAGGSILMEDVPGVGKTTLAKALASSLKAKFSGKKIVCVSAHQKRAPKT